MVTKKKEKNLGFLPPPLFRTKSKKYHFWMASIKWRTQYVNSFHSPMTIFCVLAISRTHLWFDGGCAELANLLFGWWQHPLLLQLSPLVPLLHLHLFLLLCPPLALNRRSLWRRRFCFTWIEGITFHWASWWWSTFSEAMLVRDIKDARYLQSTWSCLNHNHSPQTLS